MKFHNSKKVLFVIVLLMVAAAVASCGPTPTPPPATVVPPISAPPSSIPPTDVPPTLIPTLAPPTVKFEPLPVSVQAGVQIPVKVNITGDYDTIEFNVDNGDFKTTPTGDNLIFWTPINSDELAGIGVEVFYDNNTTPIKDVIAVTVEKAPNPVCPSTLEITTPLSNGEIEHNLMVQGNVEGLEDGMQLRIATFPYITNNIHPQEAKPEGENWSVTVYAGQQGDVSIGEQFDLLIFVVNAAGDYRMDDYLKTALESGSYPGMSTIEGATECLRIENLTRK